MKKTILTFLIAACISFGYSQTWPASLAGRWTFDNTSNLLAPATGNPLTLTGSHAAVAGPQAGDGAVSIDVGSYYSCTHGMAANGGGSLVNEYSILFDVMISNPTQYHSLFQTNTGNTNDGDCFINTSSQLGLSTTGYSGFSLKARTWYRILVCVDNGASYRIYVNGHQVLEGVSQAVDDRFSLDPSVLFFADENAEDNMICAAQLAIFNTCLSSSEVAGLGGFRTSDIKPYLQTPTPASMYISWNAWDNASTLVLYGTTTSLGNSTSGSFENVSTNRWHTVKLTGLTPATRYYYRCISGSDTSAMYHFRTPANSGTPGQHVRIIKVGDSQANAGDVSRNIADTIVFKMKQLYGNDWMDSISFVMHSGDCNQDGSEIGRYMNEFFNPYSVISAYVPMMISIGNHEGESAYFYQFMKYSDLTGNNEKYYTFQLGNCQFIALNTSGTYNTITQTNWVQSQLNQSAIDPATDFVLIYNHQPGHSELWPDGNNSYVESTLLPLFKQYPKIVMTTCGHSHNYERGTIRTTHSSNWDFRAVLSGGAGGALDRWGMYANQVNYNDIQKTIDHYSFNLMDVDVDAKTVHATTYSLGHTDKPRNLEVIDQWHRYLNQAAPAKPLALAPSGTALNTAVLTASPFAGQDTLMSSQFQLVAISGSFSSPLIDVTRDSENLFGDSGSPLYTPLNLNAAFDLHRYAVAGGVLSTGTTYMWRMRYRDENVRWSDWSDTLMFTVVASQADQADFVADITSGVAPLTVAFTDLSAQTPTNWDWDLDGDGFSDSNIQDPVFTYSMPGLYTVSLTTTINSQVLTKSRQFYINVLTSGISAMLNSDAVHVQPNPSAGEMLFILETPVRDLRIDIYDLQGKQIRSLYYAEYTPFQKPISWDGRDYKGNMINSGMYLCRISSGSFCAYLKLIRQ